MAIVVASVLVSAAAVALGPPAADARAAAREVATTLRAARAAAASGGAPVWVRFDPKARLVRIDDAAPVALDGGVRLTLETANEAAGPDGAPGIGFFPEGGATGGRVTLSDARSTATVEVRWLTGAVRVD